MTHRARTCSPRLLRVGVLAALFAGLSIVSGCGAFGALAASWERTGTSTIKPKHDALAQHSFAVLVSTSRAIEGDFPDLTRQVTLRVTQALAEHAGASGVVPPDDVLAFTAKNPGWPAKNSKELSAALAGVERLVFIEITEFRLHEPGNVYEWAGVAAGSVSVSHADSASPEIRAFDHAVRVGFPTKKGIGPDQISSPGVATELLRRFCERTAWLFYTHEEPNIIDY